jgi:hypothetical protein
MYLKACLVVFVYAVAFSVPSVAARQAASHPNAAPESAVVECRVLEAHTSAAPAALVVIFHQQEKKDQPRLAALIKANSGSDADIQIGGAAWIKARIFRLRTCFGRGMVIMSPEEAALKDGDTFRIRFSNAARK